MARLLTFEPEGHTYELDGEELPSVSELTRFISREIYSEINQSVLDYAADRGTRIHKVTECLDRYGDAEADDDILPYIEAYIKFRNEHTISWEHIEKAMYNPELMYAMTIDRYGEMNGKKILLDIKSSSQIQTVAVTAQLTLYKMGLESNEIPVDEMYVLRVAKDGKYQLKKIEPDYELANACICLHNRLKKKRRKKKDAGE